MEDSESFLSDDVAKYGLTGTNTTFNPDRYPELDSKFGFFSKDNHFVFGYNGNHFNNRKSSSCIFYTSYGETIAEPPQYNPLEEQLLIDVEDIISTVHPKKIAIFNDGTAQATSLCNMVSFLEPDAVQIVPDFSKYRHNGSLPNLQTLRILGVINDRISDYAVVRTRSIPNVLKMMAVDQFMDYCILFPSSLRIINHNTINGRVCGPPNFAVCDTEEDMAVLRYVAHYKHDVQVILMDRWSPSSVASQLYCYDYFKSDISDSESDNSIYSGKYLPTTMENAFRILIDGQHDKAKYNESWFTPVSRMFEKFLPDVEYPEHMKNLEYGKVL